jgi:uncharacterized protein
MRRKKRALPDSPITAALFGKTRRRLLAWLFAHPDDAFYVRQLVRIVGGSLGDVPRELQRLEAAGILRRTRQGRQVYFQPDPTSPIFKELSGIFRKTLAGRPTRAI